MHKTPQVAVSFFVPPEIREILGHRATINNRSLSKEILFLLESALAAESETVRGTLHLLWRTTGGPGAPAS